MQSLISLSVNKIEKLSNESLLAKKEELDDLQAQLDELKDEVKAELKERVIAEQEKTGDPTAVIKIGDKVVKLVPRRTYTKVDIDWATARDAIKTVPDSKKLEILFDEGIDIPGLQTTEYPLVTKAKIK